MELRKLMSGVAAVVLLFAASACGSDSEPDAAETSDPPNTGAPANTEDAEWQEIVEAANEEGEVTVYGTSSATIAEALPAAFAEDYPNITLNYERINLTESEARIEAELQSGLIADVIESGSLEYMQRMSDEGNLAAPVGPAFSDPAYPHEESRATEEAFAYIDAAYGWAWNTDLVPDGITSFDDFLDLDPGLLGMVDPSISAILVDEYENLEEGAGAGYLDRLAAADLDPQLYPGGNPAAAALAAGEIGAVLELAVAQVAPLKAAGSPIEYKVFDGSWLPRVWAMVLEDAPHPNAAQVYANWLISENAQQLIADAYGAPILESVEFEIIPPDVNPNLSQPVTPEQVEAFMRRWGQLFG